MTSGRPMTDQERQYILANKDEKFPGQIAKDLGRCRKAVMNVIRESEKFQ